MANRRKGENLGLAVIVTAAAIAAMDAYDWLRDHGPQIRFVLAFVFAVTLYAIGNFWWRRLKFREMCDELIDEHSAELARLKKNSPSLAVSAPSMTLCGGKRSIILSPTSLRPALRVFQ